jgi:hypothetical protein
VFKAQIALRMSKTSRSALERSMYCSWTLVCTKIFHNCMKKTNRSIKRNYKMMVTMKSAPLLGRVATSGTQHKLHKHWYKGASTRHIDKWKE